MARIADHEIVNVTDGRFADTSPVFTLDGLYLAFLSQRSFDPVYDAHTFDLSFPFGGRPYLVPLAAGTPSPFGPVPAGRPLGQDNGDEPAAEPAVTVDVDGLAGRVLAVPVEEGRYRYLRPVKGGLVWLRSQVAGVLGEGGAGVDDDRPRPALERFDLRKREVKELAGALDWFRVSGDGTCLVIRDHDELRIVPSARKHDDAGETVTVDLTRARFTADPEALWQHAYGEVGRFIRRDFWTPDMSGVDWDGALGGYRPLLDRIRSAADFADLLWELVGELGTSHAYVTAAANGTRNHTPVGQLGADISRDAAGRWLVDRVLPGESSDPRARSPLAAPGAAVGPGDELVAVDGQPVDSARGPWPLLAGTAGQPVELTVRPRSSAEVRRVVVVPLRSDRRLRYQDWVSSRRQLVRELSDGRLGYLHIPDMMGEGWAHFHRDMRTEMSREGLIFDVRGNSGGHISELVVEKLARQVTAWTMGRYMRPRTYPREARRGPMVTVADEFAGSDGDIVTAVVKLLGLGPVIGTRTWGGVVGIDGYQGLIDGSAITVPRYAIYFEEYGWTVENYGVDPDMEVLITPDDAAAGRDTQLETAVQVALEAMDKQPPPAPPDISACPAQGPPPAAAPPRPLRPVLAKAQNADDPRHLPAAHAPDLGPHHHVLRGGRGAGRRRDLQGAGAGQAARAPAGPAARRADHAGPHLQPGRRVRRGNVLHRGHRADRVRRDRLHHPDGPAAAQPGLDDRARPAPRRRHGQPRRPPVPGPGPAPRPGRGLDQPAPLPVDLQPRRRLGHLRRRHHRHPGPARRPHRRHHPRPRRPPRPRPRPPANRPETSSPPDSPPGARTRARGLVRSRCASGYLLAYPVAHRLRACLPAG